MPLLSGGGSPLKFIEALAHGLPVVATPRGAAGRGRRGGRATTSRAPAPTASRGAVLEALDPARGAALGAAGRALAERDYSIEALARRLRMKIVSVMTSATRGGAEYAAVRLLDAVAARGHETVLLTSHPDTAEGTRVAARHVELGPKLGSRSWPRLALTWPLVLRRLRRELEREAPYDVLLLHFKKEQLLAPRLPAELRPRVAWAEWGPVPTPLRGGAPGRLYRARRPRGGGGAGDLGGHPAARWWTPACPPTGSASCPTRSTPRASGRCPRRAPPTGGARDPRRRVRDRLPDPLQRQEAQRRGDRRRRCGWPASRGRRCTC